MQARRGGGGPVLLGAVTVAAILGVFVSLRLPLLTVEASAHGWNGDTSIFGLMARKIHDGRGFDVFYWGQNYMGPLTPALAAGIRRAVLDPSGFREEAGPIALRLASMTQIALGICLFFAGLSKLFGPVVAAATGLWLAVGPAYFVRLSAVHRAGPEMAFLIGSVLFLLAADALTKPRPFLDRPAGHFAFGLLAGLGWWMNQTVVFVLLPVACLVAVRAARPVWRAAAAVFAGAILGYLPVWLGGLLGWYERAAGPVLPPWRLADAPARLGRFVWSDFWRITGLEGMAPPAVLAVSGVLLLLALASGASKTADPPGEAGTSRVAALALVGGIAGLGAAAAVLRDVDPAQLRYVAPALPAMLALVAVALGEAARLVRRRAPAPAVVLALAVLAAGTALFLVREARAAVESVLREPDPRGPLRAIAAQGYAVCHAGYDTAYTLQFLSDERVRFIPYHSPDRNRAQSARLRAEPGPQCLVTDDGAVRRWLPADAAQEGGPARRRTAKE